MIQLGRIDVRVQNTGGAAVSGASVEVRRQGATVKGAQSGTSPFTVSVDDIGSLRASDTVVIGTGSTTYNVDSVSIATAANTVTISGFAGTLVLADEDRFSPTNSLPTLYNDSQRNETVSNPLTTSSIGQVTAWAPFGFYDRRISGTGITTQLIQDFYVGRQWSVFDATDARYGLAFNGSTVDTTALQRLLDRALEAQATNYSGGAIVQLPPGICRIDAQLLLGERSGIGEFGRVTLRGSGPYTTKIIADAAFPSSTSMIRIGAGLGNNIHGCRIEDLELDCNNVAGSIGVTSTQCQEGSGLSRVNINNFKDAGCRFTTAGCQNYTLRSIYTGHTSTTGIGLDFDTSGRVMIEDVTVNSNDGTQSTNPGIRAVSSSLHIESFHAEKHDIGVHFSTSATGSLRHAVGHATVPTVVRIDQPGVNLWNIGLSGSTTAINDTITGGAGAIVPAGGTVTYYMHSLAGDASTRSILSSEPDTISRFWSHVELRGRFMARPAAGAATAHVAGDYALSAGWGSTAVLTPATGTNDVCGSFSVASSGAGIGASPTVTLTFKDGAFVNAPTVIVTRGTDANQPTLLWTVTSTTTTAVFTFQGTPVTANSYVCAFLIIGK